MWQSGKVANVMICVVKNVAKWNVMICGKWKGMRCCCMQWLLSRMHVDMMK